MLLNKRISIVYFIKQIRGQILLILAFSLLVGLLDLMPGFRRISLPLAVTAMLGTVVSLLLAFRTSQSYERWWEGRIVWGAIVNDSRTFIRQVIQFMPPEEKQIVAQFAQRQIVWTYALGESLRRQPFSGKVQDYLQQQNISGQNIPNNLLDEHSRQVAEVASQGLLSDFKQVQLNETIARLCDSMGRCERIKNTVFPRSYSLLLHTLIYVFAFTLPFGLDDAQLIVEIVLTAFIPIVFIAIESTAIIMQDPFENAPADVPVTALSQTIERNILEMTGEEDLPPLEPVTTYYQM